MQGVSLQNGVTLQCKHAQLLSTCRVPLSHALAAASAGVGGDTEPSARGGTCAQKRRAKKKLKEKKKSERIDESEGNDAMKEDVCDGILLCCNTLRHTATHYATLQYTAPL